MEVFGCLADADVFKYFWSAKIFFVLDYYFCHLYPTLTACTNSIENNATVRLRRRQPATGGAQGGQDVGQGATHVLGCSALQFDLTDC